LNSYSSNGTSIFILKHVRPGIFGVNWTLLLDFYYKMNSDTLTDFGMIEASIDNGSSWINLMTQDTTYGLYWQAPKPVLTGNINSRTHFSLNLTNITYVVGYSDTVLYRFTFISDSNQTNKDGWIIDNFYFEDIWEGIPEFQNNIVSIYPNPTNERLFIERTQDNNSAYIKVFDQTGKLIMDDSSFKGEELDTKQLENGCYILKYSDSKNCYMKKFIVQH
jgi:hypothetical protein